MAVEKKAIVLKLSEHLRLDAMRSCIINACNMAHYWCTCIRLRWKSQIYDFPLRFVFSYVLTAKRFIRSRQTVVKSTSFPGMKVISDRPNLQRATLLKSQHPYAANTVILSHP